MSGAKPTVVADRGDAGARIDHVIRRHLADRGVSRARVQRWIDEGLVMVNGAPARRAAARASLGDRIELPPAADPPRRTMRAERRDEWLDVIFEDDHLLALNKPPGLVVHPTFGHAAGTIMNALLWRARGWAADAVPALVGRLDKDTSGVLLVSKHARVHAALQRATAAGAARKEYLAIVYGGSGARRGTIDLPLAADPADRRRSIPAAGGAPSTTRFERLARLRVAPAGVALLRCTLHSGRRHQIRAHLAARGLPIVGDRIYGTPRWREIADTAIAARLRDFPRQALHARRLAFVHPVSLAPIDIVAPVAADMAALAEALGFGSLSDA